MKSFVQVIRRSWLAAGVLCLCCAPVLGREPAQATALEQAARALAEGRADEALEHAERAVAAAPTDPRGFVARAAARGALKRHAEAIDDYTAALRLRGDSAELLDRRGAEHFKDGQIEKSIADFDRAIALEPTREAGHWQRGIALYYAKRYDEGARQFEGYQNVDANDVENAVWQYLCVARAQGREEARRRLLKVGHDRRVPLMTVYALFQGEATEAEVLAAARAGDPRPEELRERLFYAHLYLGLYHEAFDRPQQALEHLTVAAERETTPHYMGDVARVHVRRLREVAGKP
jgi:lipoprotein NlpI